MDAKQLLGQRVKKYRRQLGLTMEEMAYRCGLHASYIALLEGGKRNPSLDTLEKVALGLDVQLCDLLDFNAEPEITIYDTTTNKIISTVSRLSEQDREQALVVVNALARVAEK